MCQPSHCSPKGLDTRLCASKDAGPKGEGEQTTIYKSVETFP